MIRQIYLSPTYPTPQTFSDNIHSIFDIFQNDVDRIDDEFWWV